MSLSLRECVIALARKQNPDIGDVAMIVSGEWSYCVGVSVFVSKVAVANAIRDDVPLCAEKERLP